MFRAKRKKKKKKPKKWIQSRDKFKYLCCIHHLIGSIRWNCISIKMYWVVGNGRTQWTDRGRRRSMENGCEDILESLRVFFLLLSFVIHSKWSGQIVWNVCVAILDCVIVSECFIFTMSIDTIAVAHNEEKTRKDEQRSGPNRRSVGWQSFRFVTKATNFIYSPSVSAVTHNERITNIRLVKLIE